MDQATITSAALEALEEGGFEKLSMRAVAARLGVHVGGLYYHVADRAALMRTMSDVLCARALDDLAPTGPWRTDAAALCHGVRRSILACRDGARLLAASPMVGSVEALRLMERLMSTLAGGLPAAQVPAAADTLMSYVTGFVLQEQLEASAGGPDRGMSETDLAKRFPWVFEGVTQPSSDATFAAGVEAILRGFAP